MGDRTGVWAWLELARVSNLPTVWSNALVGVACAAWARGEAFGARAWAVWAGSAACLSCLYVAGMIHNDICDAGVDARERPRRPIPSGRVSRKWAQVVCVALVIVGIEGWWFGGPWAVCAAVALAFLALTYSKVHQHTAWSVLMLGGCRALAVVTPALALRWWTWPPPTVAVVAGGVLGAYVVVVSLVARGEAAAPGDRRRVRVVVGMLCAISAIDATWLVGLGMAGPAVAAVGCCALACWMQRRILGT
mgnify:CR=1 FL=1